MENKGADSKILMPAAAAEPNPRLV